MMTKAKANIAIEEICATVRAGNVAAIVGVNMSTS